MTVEASHLFEHEQTDTYRVRQKKQSPKKNFVSQQWQHEFEPNFQAVYTSIRATYLANFIKTADMLSLIHI